MKTITVNKLNKVDAPESEKTNGIVAFQMCEFVINHFGNEMTIHEDTKILEDGKQLVINGNGFIPAGYEVKA